ncbi:MAG: hypothetical protein ABIZ56_05905 [Chthoniobacteraceae bacterium]
MRLSLYWSERLLVRIAGILALLMVFAAGVWVGRRSLRPSGAGEAMAKIESERVQAIEAVVLSQTAGRAPISGADRLKQFRATLKEAAEKLSEDERKPLLAARELVARVQPQMAEYETTLKALADARYVAPASIKTQDDLKARRSLVKRFSEANEALIRYFENAERDYRAALDKLGVADNLKQGVLDGFRRGGNFDLNLKIHESNRQLAASMQEMLKLLDREWGGWRTDERGAAIFDREDAVKEFETVQGDLTAAAVRHEAAEKKLIERAALSQKR